MSATDDLDDAANYNPLTKGPPAARAAVPATCVALLAVARARRTEWVRCGRACLARRARNPAGPADDRHLHRLDGACAIARSHLPHHQRVQERAREGQDDTAIREGQACLALCAPPAPAKGAAQEPVPIAMLKEPSLI